MLSRLIAAGMDGARLNFSHGTHEQHALSAQRVREAQAAAGRPIALIADLQGPKLRIGDMSDQVELEVGETIVVAGADAAREGDLPVAPAVLGSVLKPDQDVLVDDGHVRLRVLDVDAGRVLCRVVTGGVVEQHKGVNVPGVALPVPSLTQRTSRISTSRSGSGSTTSRSPSCARGPMSRRFAHGSRLRERRHGSSRRSSSRRPSRPWTRSSTRPTP